MKRKAVASAMEPDSSKATELNSSPQHASEENAVDRGESLTHQPPKDYIEVVDPLLQPSHTIPAEKEPAYTTEKEAIYNGAEKEAVYNPDDWKEVGKREVAELPITTQERKRKLCGLPRIWCLGLTALVAVAIMAIAVAVGVHFGTKHTQSVVINSNFSIGGYIDPRYYSTTGALNGSGIALASVNFGLDSSLYVFFQHYSGEIRSVIQEANGDWTDSNVVVPDARNGTPISAVAYVNEETANWHIFYVDFQGLVRQRVTSNGSDFQTNIWQDGPLNDLDLQTNNADMIGLQACYWGNFFGDTDYTDGNFSSNTTQISTGIHLWYADTNTSFQQYSYIYGQDQWQFDTKFSDQNGQAGVGCQTWESGTVYYISMVDLDDNINIWWKDSNNSNPSTPNHPINQWTKSPVTIHDVHPSTSMGYLNYLAYQGSDGFIRGVNISWAAENTSIYPARDGTGLDSWIIPNAGVLGTYLSITALADESGGAHLSVWFQQNGSDISQFVRDFTSDAWLYDEVPVNQ